MHRQDSGTPQAEIDPADESRGGATVPRSSGPGRSAPAARWRRTLFVPAATALAIVILALVVLLGSGSRAPTVAQTAKLALTSATAPAPARDTAHPALLAAAVDGIPFPYSADTNGWEATGSRTEVVHERTIVTVYYRAADGTRAGYAIVPGASLSIPGGAVAVRHGVRYTFGRAGSGRYATWVRDGHTCLIAASGASDRVLLGLASADERATV